MVEIYLVPVAVDEHDLESLYGYWSEVDPPGGRNLGFQGALVIS